MINRGRQVIGHIDNVHLKKVFLNSYIIFQSQLSDYDKEEKIEANKSPFQIEILIKYIRRRKM